MTEADFHRFIKPMDDPRIRLGRENSLADYASHMLSEPKAIKLKAAWEARMDEPFRGITTDGTVVPDLFAPANEGFDPAPAVAAAQALLEALPADQRDAVGHAIDAREWRGWYNPEIPFNDYGVRLEDMPGPARDAFLALLGACTSARGAEKLRQLFKANLFLGELYELPHIMNDWSYHFLMFGTPSRTAPWGWSVYGHHAAFNCFILGSQIVISPTFMGVEPNEIALKSGERFTLFDEEETLGLALMQSLSPDLRARATVYALMEDPAMPPERFNFADQRHLAGAFQDNRVIPLEGVSAAEFSDAQRAALLRLIECFLEHLPDAPRAARMAGIAACLDQTWWSWIGGHGDDDPFYFRIQSPVILIEFDHHSGMWLTNEDPQKFHVHVITRIPNGNDYGRALLRAHQRLAGA